MNGCNADQVGALGLVELIQVRLVLEEVGVQAVLDARFEGRVQFGVEIPERAGLYLACIDG